MKQRQQIDTTTQTYPYSTNGETRTWNYGYNDAGLLTSVQVPSGSNSDTTLLGYNSFGYLTSITNALNQSLQITSLDGAGRPVTERDPSGVSIVLAYDGAGRLLSRNFGGQTTSYAYGSTGLLNKITLPDASFIQYVYDNARRLTQVSDSLGDVEAYTLDVMGDRTAENVYDPSGALVRMHSRVFDSLGRIFEEINSAETSAVTTNFSYDGNGNLTTTAAPLYRNTINAYDALNRLSQRTDPGGGITQFGYDALDRIVSVSDPRSLITTYTYSGLGDLIQLSSPDTGASINTYDVGGKPVTVTDGRGAVASYFYDALNRVTAVAYSLSGQTDQTITFAYDQGNYGVGRLTSASDATHSMSFSYDGLGEATGVTQVVGGVSLAVGYAYTNGDFSTLTTPSGQTVAYGYNGNHEITSIAVNGTTVLSNVSYEPFGPANGWTWGNGDAFTRSFNADGLITGIASAGSQESLSYDDAGRISGITDTAPGASGWTYGYDQNDRLTSAMSSAITQGWTYDANGNRLSESGTSSSTYSIAATSNEITAINGALNRVYGYDASGNTLSNSDFTATYNDAGRLKSETNSSGTITFVYNALEQMIEASGPQGSTLYFYDQAGHLIGEYDGTGNLIQETVWLGDIPVATIQPAGSSVAIYYVETDQLGGPQAIIRPSDNALIWTWFSRPFGNDAPNQNPQGAGNFNYDLRFPGQISGNWNSTYQNDHRDYDPQVGRYVESDPIGLHGGINTYAYVDSDPEETTDRFGLFSPGDWLLSKLPGNDSCKTEEWKYCEAKCAPAAVDGCYVTLHWKLKGIRGGEPIRVEQRIVECDCRELDCPYPSPKKGRRGSFGSSSFGSPAPWWESIPAFE